MWLRLNELVGGVLLLLHLIEESCLFQQSLTLYDKKKKGMMGENSASYEGQHQEK